MNDAESFSSGRVSKITKVRLVLFCALLVAGGCTRHQPQDPARSKEAAAARADRKDDVFVCPDGDIQKTGSSDHKVSLTWNPSRSQSKEVRYCLYRTEDHRVQKSDDRGPIGQRPCKMCTRVNEKAIPETHYVDTQVRNGAHYCYVAVAMEVSNSAFSGFSNQVQADIPRDPTPVPPQISSGKLCEDKKPSAKASKKGSR